MIKLDDGFEGWMEARLQHWKEEAQTLLDRTPKWRDNLPPSVNAVLLEAYNPFVHRAMLQAAGADPSVVDTTLEGFTLSGPQPPTGFYEPLPACKAQDLIDADDALQAALTSHTEEFRRILTKGHPRRETSSLIFHGS